MVDITRHLRRLFRSLDAFDTPFRPSVAVRMLLFPTNGFVLTQEQFGALASSVSHSRGECIVVITEGKDLDEPEVQFEHHPFHIESFQSYTSLREQGFLEQENVITDVHGEWAVLISQESHALIGGPVVFVESFQAKYNGRHDDLNKFIRAWERNEQKIHSDISWMPKLLKHLSNN